MSKLVNSSQNADSQKSWDLPDNLKSSKTSCSGLRSTVIALQPDAIVTVAPKSPKAFNLGATYLDLNKRCSRLDVSFEDFIEREVLRYAIGSRGHVITLNGVKEVIWQYTFAKVAKFLPDFDSTDFYEFTEKSNTASIKAWSSVRDIITA